MHVRCSAAANSRVFLFSSKLIIRNTNSYESTLWEETFTSSGTTGRNGDSYGGSIGLLGRLWPRLSLIVQFVSTSDFRVSAQHSESRDPTENHVKPLGLARGRQNWVEYGVIQIIVPQWYVLHIWLIHARSPLVCQSLLGSSGKRELVIDSRGIIWKVLDGYEGLWQRGPLRLWPEERVVVTSSDERCLSAEFGCFH